MQFKIEEHCSVVDPGFSRWRGRQPIILAILFPKLHEIEPNFTEEGARP